MESPQLENGYVRIANELFEAIIRFPFCKRELKVLLAVLRKTYGYGKKADDISLSQLSNMTGIQVSHLSATLKKLESMKVLLIQEGQHAKNLSINKVYGQWRGLLKQEGVTETVSSQNRKGGVPKTVTNPFPKQEPQKTTQKTTPKERARKRALPDDFEPNEKHKKLADDSGVDLPSELEQFRDYHKAKGSTMKDWDAALRTWIRNAKKFGGAKKPKELWRLSDSELTRMAADRNISTQGKTRQRLIAALESQ